MTNNDDFSEAMRRLARLRGHRVWGTSLGWGSFLSLNFGPPLADDPDFGVLRLWVEQAAWRWETDDRILASSEDPREQLSAAVRDMDALTVTGIRVESPSLSARFDFDDGSRLRTFTIYTDPAGGMKHWMAYLPDGQVFVAGPGGNWSISPDSSSGRSSEVTA